MENKILTLLTKRIQELCPEIMELKFGCQIKPRQSLAGYGRSYIVVDYPSVTKITKKKRWDIEHLSDSAMSCRDAIDEDKFDIIGRPIQLSDILMAITEEDPRIHILVDNFGSVFRNNEEICIWNLGKPLADQSKETLEALYNILK